MRRVRVTQASDYDLVGEVIEEAPLVRASRTPAQKRRVSLKVLAADT
jgi:hypothetical protein